MLVIRGNDLKLDAFWPDELNRLTGVIGVNAALANQFDVDPGFLEHFADCRLVREFILFNMAAWRKPDPEFGMRVQDHVVALRHEYGHREVPGDGAIRHVLA